MSPLSIFVITVLLVCLVGLCGYHQPQAQEPEVAPLPPREEGLSCYAMGLIKSFETESEKWELLPWIPGIQPQYKHKETGVTIAMAGREAYPYPDIESVEEQLAVGKAFYRCVVEPLYVKNAEKQRVQYAAMREPFERLGCPTDSTTST